MIYEVLSKDGQFVVAMPEGHPWGICERDPAKFLIEKTDDLAADPEPILIEMAGSGATFMLLGDGRAMSESAYEAYVAKQKEELV